MRVKTPGLLVFLACFTIFCLTINGVWAADHPNSFIELDYSLWTSHSVVLGPVGGYNLCSPAPCTLDDLVYKGNYYSALAPGTAFLALPFIGLGFALAGGFSFLGPVLTMAGLFIALMAALGCYLMYKLASLCFRRSTSVFLAFTLAFSTIVWPFAGWFYQNDVSVTFLLLTAYAAIRASSATRRGRLFSVVCGLAAGVAVTVDYVNAVVIPVALVYLALSRRRKGLPLVRESVLLLLSSAVGLGLLGVYNYLVFRNPLTFTEAVYIGSASPLSGFSYPIYQGILYNFFSPLRGLFLYSPFLVLGILGYSDAFHSKARWDFLFMLAIFFGILLPYSAWYDPSGGASYGPRFLLGGIPYLVLPAGYIIEGRGKKAIFAAFALFMVGEVINGAGSLVSAIPPPISYAESPFLSSSLPGLAKGNLDTWWVGWAGGYWYIAAAVVLMVAAAIPLGVTLYLRSREERSIQASSPDQYSKKH